MAVNGKFVQRTANGGFECLCQKRFGYGDISTDNAYSRCHIGPNHAGAFYGTSYGDFFA